MSIPANFPAAMAHGRPRTGFTLLEVILALAIMAGAIAVIGELERNGLRSSQEARDLTRAELVAESVVSEVASGYLPASTADNQPYEDDARWLYSVAVDQGSQSGLLNLTVTVTRDMPAQQHPVRFVLKRWIIDPSVEEQSQEAEQAAMANSSTATGSSTSASGSGSSTSSSSSSSSSKGTGT